MIGKYAQRAPKLPRANKRIRIVKKRKKGQRTWTASCLNGGQIPIPGSLPCVEAPRVRRNWLAKAALATVALSVPMAGVAGGAQAANLPAGAKPNAVVPGNHGPLRKPLKKAKSHRASTPEKAYDTSYTGKHRL